MDRLIKIRMISNLVIGLSLITITISAVPHCPPPPALLPDQELFQSPSDIRSLFSTSAKENLTYPESDVPGPKPRDQWVQVYQQAQARGFIPPIPPSKVVDGRAVYPSCYDDYVCNPGLNACNDSVDVLSAPPGMAGISFDDGPQPPSLDLLAYLKSQAQKATHFLIGSRIMSNPDIFKALDEASEHLAVHTWSHPMMTSLTDLEVVGEIGWTMQLIHDWSQNSPICAYWRPPYGDTDQRVQAIAKHVFGLQTILWLYDPDDWCLADSKPNGSACAPGDGPQNLKDLENALDLFVESDKEEGLIILEHEQSTRAVEGFKYILPHIRRSKWIPRAIPDLFGSPWYQ